MSDSPPVTVMPGAKNRAYWLKTLHQWHWISSALCLVGMLLLAFTGITLNHAGKISATPEVTKRTSTLPESLLTQLQGMQAANAPLPEALREWLQQNLSVRAGARAAEWSEEEIYLPMPRPGGDAWLSIDRESGAVEYEDTDRGWISYFNDLHKGRHTGTLWVWFLDLLAVATLIFSITGLLLLKLHSSQRPATWPMVALGLTLPLLLALLFIH